MKSKQATRAQVAQAHHQKSLSTAVVAKTLLDLRDKNQLTTHQIKQDQKDALNTMIKVCNLSIHCINICAYELFQESIHGLTKEEQFDKAAQATVNNQ